MSPEVKDGRTGSEGSWRAARPGRLRRKVAVLVGAGYPLGLVAAWLLLRFSGQSSWLPVVALYAPPVGFLFPAPIALFVTWRWATRPWLLVQMAAVVFAIFGLLGLELGFGRDLRAAEDPAAVRLLSYNIELGHRGVQGVVAQVTRLRPNLVLLQESHEGLSAELGRAFAGWHIDQHGQFFIASRFPIVEVREPEPLRYHFWRGGAPVEGEGGARFMAYTVATGLGLVDVYSVHTTSPREGLEQMRGQGFLHELRRGRILLGQGADRLIFNAYRRRRQIEAVAAAAHDRTHPVIVAGDFNMPSLSRVMRDNLGDFADAFVQAGRGFGYTFPSKLPFLRIDRIFVGPGLRAVDFRRGDTQASDHLCISATIVRAAP